MAKLGLGVGGADPTSRAVHFQMAYAGKTQSTGHRELTSGFAIEKRPHVDLQVGCSGLF